MIDPKIMQQISDQAVKYANLDDRLPFPLFDNNTFTSSNLEDKLAIDYNKTDVAMGFIGYQEAQRRKKKKMDGRSLLEVYDLLEDVAWDAINLAVDLSMEGDRVGFPNLLPAILDEMRMV